MALNFNASKIKQLLFHLHRESFLHAINMAEANQQESNSLRLLGLTFLNDMNRGGELY